MRNRRPYIYQQIRILHRRHDDVVEFHVGVEVPLGKVAHQVVVAHKNLDSFKNRPVLNYGLPAMGNCHHVLETLREEIGFEVVGPTRNVRVVVFKIGVICHGLELRRPAVMLSKHPRESRLAASYISCDTNVHSV